MDFFKLAILVGMLGSALLQAQSPYGQQQPTVPQQPGYAPQQQPGFAPGYAPQQAPAYAAPANAQQQQAGGVQLTPEEDAALRQAFADTANVASQWLKLVDDGRYGDSWDYASQTFQFTIKKGEWEIAEQKVRAPLGRLVSRELLNQLPAKDPKGLPKGDYMVLVYKSSFSGRPEVRELVTMVKESDGKWRVLTYQAA